MSGKVGQPKAELTNGLAALVTRNSCPALCWPIRFRSQSPICCSYQSSNRRVSGGRLDSTDRIQIVDIGGSQPLAVDLIGADEEISPPVELWAEIEGQAEVRQSFIDQACRTPPLTLPRNSSISVTAGIMPRLVSSDRSPPISPRSNFVGLALGGGGAGAPAEGFVGRRSHVGPDRGEQYRCRSGLDHCSHDQIIATTVAVTPRAMRPYMPVLRLKRLRISRD